MTQNLPIADIKADGEIQMRAEVDLDVVHDYAEAMRAGAEFPPVVVFRDPSDVHWLADGFQRFQAARQTGAKEIACDVREGTRRDAILYAVGANAVHGVRRSNADKRKAVAAMLEDPEWRNWSDRKIADAVSVTHPFVGRVRLSVAPETIRNQTPNSEVETLPPKGDQNDNPSVQSGASGGVKKCERCLAKMPAKSNHKICVHCRGEGLKATPQANMPRTDRDEGNPPRGRRSPGPKPPRTGPVAGSETSWSHREAIARLRIAILEEVRRWPPDEIEQMERDVAQILRDAIQAVHGPETEQEDIFELDEDEERELAEAGDTEVS